MTATAEQTEIAEEQAEAAARVDAYHEHVLRTTVEKNHWIPRTPFPKQAAFLATPAFEVMYGGSLAGGKSEALLMAAAQYVTRPNYRCLIIRQTISELQMPGALIERSKKWWIGTAARYNENLHRWKFPSGAEIWFGYLGAKNWSRYMSSEWDCIIFDEIVTIPETTYRLLSGRIRQNVTYRDLSDVPPRVRAASNPPTADQETTGWWVKVYFVDRGFPYFMPSSMADNPYVDEPYIERLRLMFDPVTFAKLATGNWSIRAAGGYFKREMFRMIDAVPVRGLTGSARGYDLAATPVSPQSPDPDYTVGILMSRFADGAFLIHDLRQMRALPGDVMTAIRFQAWNDPLTLATVLPVDPAQAGKAQAEAYTRLLAGRYVVTVPQSGKGVGDKIARATPFMIQVQAGNVYVLRAPWNEFLFSQLEAEPHGRHHDVMDAASIGFNHLTTSAPLDTTESGWAGTWANSRA